MTRAHGVHGEVAVLVLSEIEDRFAPGSVVVLENGGPLTVRSSRPHRGRLLVRFEELADRAAAETAAGRYLFISTADVPAAAEGSFWPHELQGCEVVTEEGRSFGAITEVIHTPANDVWVASADGVEILVPALKDVVVSVDTKARRVVIRDVPGLTDE